MGTINLRLMGLRSMDVLMGKLHVNNKLKAESMYVVLLLYSFARKIIWLKLAPSNSDPRIIARYYLEAIEELAGMSEVLY